METEASTATRTAMHEAQRDGHFYLSDTGNQPNTFRHMDNICHGSVAHGEDTAAAPCPQWEVGPTAFSLFLLTVVPPGGPWCPPGTRKALGKETGYKDIDAPTCVPGIALRGVGNICS